MNQAEAWRAWEKHSYPIHRQTLLKLIHADQPHQFSITTSACRDWLYNIGLQPDQYIIKKTSYSHIEFRFATPTDLAFFKMSLGE